MESTKDGKHPLTFGKGNGQEGVYAIKGDRVTFTMDSGALVITRTATIKRLKGDELEILDSPVIRFSGEDVHRPTIDETRRFLEQTRRGGRNDGMYRDPGVFQRAVKHAAEVLNRPK